MRYVTVCEVVRERVPPGADHKHKMEERRMSPGLAWKLGQENALVRVDAAVCSAAAYAWELCWVDGRTVAVFEVGDVRFAQPVVDDPRAKNGSTRRERKPRVPRHDAPGVAPEVPVYDEIEERTKPLARSSKRIRKALTVLL